MRARRDITNAEIKALFKRHGNKSHVAMILGCSQRLVHNSLAGIRPDPEPPPDLPPEELCTCCKLQPRGKNLRFLCDDCYKNPPDQDFHKSCLSLRD
jgi:hypothetical protein